jgi:hypothetical protein
MGTMQHDAVESGEDNPRMPDYRAVAVAECIKYTEERLKAYPGGYSAREAYLPIDDMTIRCGDKDFLGTTAGYVDFAVVSKDETQGEIIDWKFGRWAVTKAEENLQGIAYMLGLKKAFPLLQHVTVRFIQPHIDFSSSHTFDISNPEPYLLRVRAVVQRAVEAAKRPDDFSTARPNIGACTFCKNIGNCTKVTEIAIQVGQKFMPLALPKEINTTSVLDPKQTSIGLKLAQIVGTWAKAYRTRVTAKAIDSDVVPEGYMLVPSQRTVIKDPKAVGELAKTFLPPEDAEKVEALYDINLTPLDDLISIRAPRLKKEATVEKFREELLKSGATELGAPFAFLRQITTGDKTENQNT